MPSWIQRKRMMSRQDKIRMMWETQQRRRNQGITYAPPQQVSQQQMVFNLAAGTNTPATVTSSAPAKKGCGCGMKI